MLTGEAVDMTTKACINITFLAPVEKKYKVSTSPKRNSETHIVPTSNLFENYHDCLNISSEPKYGNVQLSSRQNNWQPPPRSSYSFNF
jgi:hypothetical protein